MRAVLCIALVAASASCSRSFEVDGEPIGAPCRSDDECASAVCGGTFCTTLCVVEADCTAGWRCATEMPEAICDCVPGDERCNGSDDDCDGAIDEAGATLCGAGLVCSDGACACTPGAPRDTDELDLLLVIDNSGSLGEEQVTFSRELPRLVRMLASGDRDADGTVDFDPVRSLHVGVVTTDMGVGGHLVPTCGGGTFGSRFGDDGILATRGQTAIPGCMATYPPIFEFQRERDDADAFGTDLACVATTGTGGCGYEQQLEAMLKALSPSAPQAWTTDGYVPPIFVESTFGHADRENAGFVRDESVLAIVVVTDEEDCSASDPDIYNPSSDRFSGSDLSLRCFTFPEASHPIARYVGGVDGHSGLLGLRRDPSRLVYGLLAGVPVDAVPDPVAPTDYTALLSHPDMIERVDPTMPTRLIPSCNVPGFGISFPPRRMVQVAQSLEPAGAGTFVSSICQESYASAIDALVARVAEPLTRPECE
jgi:hypothetical protein